MAAENTKKPSNESDIKVESPSNSHGSSTLPSFSPPPLPQEEKQEEEEVREMDAAASAEVDSKPAIVSDGFQDFTAVEIQKYQKYEADYAHRLRAKYFSNKDFYGADIYDLTVAVGNETIKAGRRSPTQSYADPARGPEETGRVTVTESEPPSRAEPPQHVSNGNMTPQTKSL